MIATNWQEAIVASIGVILCIYVTYRIYRSIRGGGKKGRCSSCGGKCPFDKNRPCC